MLAVMRLKIIHQQKPNKIKFQFTQMVLKMMDYMVIQITQDALNLQLQFQREGQYDL